MMTEETDPFEAFGQDDSDSDHLEEDSSTDIAQSLLKKANENLLSSDASKLRRDNSNDGREGGSVDNVATKPSIDLTKLQPCNLSWSPPLYMNPNVRLVSNLPVGGGRGYVALTDLKAGTLILVEKPIMEWSEEQLGNELNLLSVRHLLKHPDAGKIVKDMEDLHPIKSVVDNVSVESENPDQVENMMMELQGRYDKDPLLTQMVQLAARRNIKNRDGTLLSSKDILRLILQLRYNGLQSGIYRYVAMLNHKCQPNCVKFLPNSENQDTNPALDFSEVRTIKHVPAGESLTISYLPSIVSHASRRRHLWDQHRFEIGADLDTNLQSMEAVSGGLPPSSKDFVDDNSVTHRIECTITEMECLYQSIKSSTEHGMSDDSWEHVKALEVSSLELCIEAKNQLQNERHLLLIPCMVLHLDACNLVLEKDAYRSSLTNTQRCKLLGREVSTAYRLVDLQKAYLGSDHFAVARTNLDLAHAIQELLSKSPKSLLELDIAKSCNLSSFREWSNLEYECRKVHQHVKNLYPCDAEQQLGGTVST